VLLAIVYSIIFHMESSHLSAEPLSAKQKLRNATCLVQLLEPTKEGVNPLNKLYCSDRVLPFLSKKFGNLILFNFEGQWREGLKS